MSPVASSSKPYQELFKKMKRIKDWKNPSLTLVIFLVRLNTLKIVKSLSLSLPPSLSLPLSSDLHVLCMEWLDYSMSPSHCNHLSFPQLPSSHVSFQFHSRVFIFPFQWLNGTVWVWVTLSKRK